VKERWSLWVGKDHEIRSVLEQTGQTKDFYEFPGGSRPEGVEAHSIAGNKNKKKVKGKSRGGERERYRKTPSKYPGKDNFNGWFDVGGKKKMVTRERGKGRFQRKR